MQTNDAEERALALALVEAIERWEMRGFPVDELAYSCRLTAIAQTAMEQVAGQRGLSMFNRLYDARHPVAAEEREGTEAKGK